jgi:hypothetical protein
VNWLTIHPKVAASLVAALTVDGAAFLGAWNGRTTWHEAIGVAVGPTITVVVGYLTPSPKPAPPS